MIKLIVPLLIIIFALAFIGSQQPTSKVIAIEPSSAPQDFRIFTQAVCEDKGDSKFCQDKVFYSCNGSTKLAEDPVVFCGNKYLEVGKVSLGSLEIAKK